MQRRWLLSAVLVSCAVTALAQVDLGTTDASDGALNTTTHPPVNNVITIDLAKAGDGNWTAPSNGKGIYDAQKWAVVFKYAEVNIPSGVTVKFTNHPSGAPVVWLVQGDVTINGTVNLNGEDGVWGRHAIPGPGGFRGGLGWWFNGSSGSGGYGPGGAIQQSHDQFGGGSYGTTGERNSGPVYGNSALQPLIGGSGATVQSSGNPGAGGGAILIASGAEIRVTGSLHAIGGSFTGSGWGGGGSGGALRLVGQVVSLEGQCYVAAAAGSGSGSANGGIGRIRIESPGASIALTARISPGPSVSTVVGSIWPAEIAPTVKISQIAGLAMPADPRASQGPIPQDATVVRTGTVSIFLETTNVPINWKVRLRIIPKSGNSSWVEATRVSGDQTSALWKVDTTLPNGLVTFQARASVN